MQTAEAAAAGVPDALAVLQQLCQTRAFLVVHDKAPLQITALARSQAPLPAAAVVDPLAPSALALLRETLREYVAAKAQLGAAAEIPELALVSESVVDELEAERAAWEQSRREYEADPVQWAAARGIDLAAPAEESRHEDAASPDPGRPSGRSRRRPRTAAASRSPTPPPPPPPSSRHAASSVRSCFRFCIEGWMRRAVFFFYCLLL